MDLDLKNLPDDASLPKDTVINLIDEIEVKYQEKIHYRVLRTRAPASRLPLPRCN